MKPDIISAFPPYELKPTLDSAKIKVYSVPMQQVIFLKGRSFRFRSNLYVRMTLGIIDNAFPNQSSSASIHEFLIESVSAKQMVYFLIDALNFIYTFFCHTKTINFMLSIQRITFP